MAEPPYMFFHQKVGFFWRDTTDPVLRNCQSINDEAAQPFLASLGVNVSEPDVLLEWLEKNDAAYITELTVFAAATDNAPRWSPLFEKLGRAATNLQHLIVYWEHSNSFHKGLGMDLHFVRALTQLKVKTTITLDGFYAQPWPSYLEREMGLKPVETGRFGARRRYQRMIAPGSLIP